MIIRIAFALSLLVLLAPATARAQSQEDTQACTDAAYQHCGEYIPDRERVYQCLVKKVKLINPTCRKAITAPGNQRR